MTHGTYDSAVTRNARRLLMERQKAEAARGRLYTSRQLARDMAAHLFPLDEEKGSAVHKTLVHYLGEQDAEKRPWRLDYLDAFARVLGASPLELFSADPRGATGYDGEAWYLIQDVLALHEAAEQEEKRWIAQGLDAVRRAIANRPALQAIVNIGALIGAQVRPQADPEPVEERAPPAAASPRRKVRAR